jgi:hypothetical protein
MSAADATVRTASGRCPSYLGFSSRRTRSYVGSAGRARLPETERRSWAHPVRLGPVEPLVEPLAEPLDVGRGSRDVGSSEVQADTAPRAPPTSNPRRV